jgi:hypothetical protein
MQNKTQIETKKKDQSCLVARREEITVGANNSSLTFERRPLAIRHNFKTILNT